MNKLKTKMLFGILLLAGVAAYQNCGRVDSFQLNEQFKLENGQGYGGIVPPDVIEGGTGGGGNPGQGQELRYISQSTCPSGEPRMDVRRYAGKFILKRENCQTLNPAIELSIEEVVFSALSSEVIIARGTFLATDMAPDAVVFCKAGFLVQEQVAIRGDLLIKTSSAGYLATVREGTTNKGKLDMVTLLGADVQLNSSYQPLNLSSGQSFSLETDSSGISSVHYHLDMNRLDGSMLTANRSRSFQSMSCYSR